MRSGAGKLGKLKSEIRGKRQAAHLARKPDANRIEFNA
jgi:hypothetical protein